MELYANTVSGGFTNLHFKDKEKEKQFVLFNHFYNIDANRRGLILSFGIWALLILYAFLFYRYALLSVSLSIILIDYPFFIALLILLPRPNLVELYQWLCAICNVCAGIVGIVLNFLVLRDALAGTVYLVGIQLAAFFFIRIRHTLAVFASLAYTAICQLIVILCGFFDAKYLFVLSWAMWTFELIFIVAGYALETATRKYFSEQKARDELLAGILPLSIAEELKSKGSTKPVRIESATILFSDFVHFTSATKGIEPISVIALLNGYFTAFDSMTQKHNLERLKTIGDGYMCAGGIPDNNNTHPIDACLMALEMLKYVKDQMQNIEGIAWNIRIGINTGSVTAGIIGSSKFSYDIWGEAVNIASRHESSGIEGSINVSKATYLLTKGFFDFKPRGQIEIKGGEKLDMYELMGIKEKYIGVDGLNKEYHDTYEKLAKGELLLGYDV